MCSSDLSVGADTGLLILAGFVENHVARRRVAVARDCDHQNDRGQTGQESDEQWPLRHFTEANCALEGRTFSWTWDARP